MCEGRAGMMRRTSLRDALRRLWRPGNHLVRLTVVLLAAALALVACSWTETDQRMAADATAADAPGSDAVAGPDTVNPSPLTVEPSPLTAAESAPAASAAPSAPPASPAPPVAPDPAAVQRAVDAAAAEAAAMDVEQAVAVVDRDTGQMVAAVSGDAPVQLRVRDEALHRCVLPAAEQRGPRRRARGRSACPDRPVQQWTSVRPLGAGHRLEHRRPLRPDRHHDQCQGKPSDVGVRSGDRA